MLCAVIAAFEAEIFLFAVIHKIDQKTFRVFRPFQSLLKGDSGGISVYVV